MRMPDSNFVVHDYIVVPYITRTGSFLDGFKQLSMDTYTFRCPYCGDSQKKRNKTRGYIYKKSNVGYMMKCHNCGVSHGIRTFIKDVNPALANELRLEIFKANGKQVKNIVEFQEYVETITPEFTGIMQQHVDSRNQIETLHVKITDDTVPSDVLDYAVNRKLPLQELYYTENIVDVLMTIEKYKMRLDENSDCYNHLTDKMAICIPYFSDTGVLTHLQYRFIDNGNFRYLTVEIVESPYKIWGLHKVDKNATVYVFEGAFDAMMVNNSVAVAQGDMASVYEYLKSLEYDCVLVHDNDYRSNKQINKQVQQSIAKGASVVLYDDIFTEKDANAMVTDQKWDCDMLESYYKKRTFNGMRAKLELTRNSSLNRPVLS